MGVATTHVAFQESCFCKDLLQRGSAPSEWYGETLSCECFSTRGNVDIWKSLGDADVNESVNESNKSFPFIPWPGLVCEWLWEMAVVAECNSFFARNRKQRNTVLNLSFSLISLIFSVWVCFIVVPLWESASSRGYTFDLKIQAQNVLGSQRSRFVIVKLTFQTWE